MIALSFHANGVQTPPSVNFQIENWDTATDSHLSGINRPVPEPDGTWTGAVLSLMLHSNIACTAKGPRCSAQRVSRGIGTASTTLVPPIKATTMIMCKFVTFIFVCSFLKLNHSARERTVKGIVCLLASHRHFSLSSFTSEYTIADALTNDKGDSSDSACHYRRPYYGQRIVCVPKHATSPSSAYGCLCAFGWVNVHGTRGDTHGTAARRWCRFGRLDCVLLAPIHGHAILAVSLATADVRVNFFRRD